VAGQTEAMPEPPRAAAESGRNQSVAFVAYLLFLLAGLGFGFAAPGRTKLVPFIFPILLAIGAAITNGIDVALILRLIVALVLTGLGIVLGILLEQRAERQEAARAA
jgi:hypothetical protein